MLFIVLAAAGAAFSSFAWGVMRFFARPGRPSGAALVVAGLGLLLTGWNTWSVVAGGTGPAAPPAGAVLNVAAVVLFWTAVRAFPATPPTAIYEPDLPTRIVTAGPYRYMRHPFYVAYMLHWIAGWLAAGSWLSLLGAVLLLGFYVRGARLEEQKFARSPLAGAYAFYRRRTGFPWPRRAGRRTWAIATWHARPARAAADRALKTARP